VILSRTKTSLEILKVEYFFCVRSERKCKLNINSTLKFNTLSTPICIQLMFTFENNLFSFGEKAFHCIVVKNKSRNTKRTFCYFYFFENSLPIST